MLYIRIPLYRVLLDLCKTENQARYWAANSYVFLVLVPLFTTTFLGMIFPRPEIEKVEFTFFLSAQLGYAVIGLIGTLVFQVLIVRRSIIRSEREHFGKQ